MNKVRHHRCYWCTTGLMEESAPHVPLDLKGTLRGRGVSQMISGGGHLADHMVTARGKPCGVVALGVASHLSTWVG